MSLYYEASSFIGPNGTPSDSLRLSVYASNQKLKNPPGKLFALLSETLKWNNALKEVIENAELLKAERKINPALSLVLVHDLLFRPKGIEAPTNHPLRSAVEKHKTRLNAELTKLRVRKKCPTLDHLKEALEHGSGTQEERVRRSMRPRWVRINRVITSLEEQLKTTFKDFERVDSLEKVTKRQASASKIPLYVDEHVPDLIAVPLNTELEGLAYREGKIILQDKASCFPAYLLEPDPDGIVIDACAAPGNKTTHLASLLAQRGKAPSKSVVAIERDPKRAKLLQQMVEAAHAERYVTVKSAQDFLKLDPNSAKNEDEPWANATALLLDPSCSGSGIIGREEGVQWNLPSLNDSKTGMAGQKRKRVKTNAETAAAKKQRMEEEAKSKEDENAEEDDDVDLHARLSNLGSFQLRVIQHALSFPKAHRVVYSTCSVHNQENEDQVLAALSSEIAVQRGWHILPRDKQPDGLRSWPIRGNSVDYAPYQDIKDKTSITDACIRCSKNDEHGTQGFFVAAFQRQIDQII